MLSPILAVIVIYGGPPVIAGGVPAKGCDGADALVVRRLKIEGCGISGLAEARDAGLSLSHERNSEASTGT